MRKVKGRYSLKDTLLTLLVLGGFVSAIAQMIMWIVSIAKNGFW